MHVNADRSRSTVVIYLATSPPREPGNARELTKDDRSGERDAVLAAEYLLNTDMIGYRRPARGP